jgi:hypothetical protein
MDRKRIWWLASYPKSGSTWMRMFINAYISHFPVDINSAWQYVAGDLQPRMYQFTCGKSLHEIDDVDCVYYRPAVLCNHCHAAMTRDLCLKTHNAKLELDGIPLIPPKLSRGALYIIRDPRDIVLSLADHLALTVDKAIEVMCNEQFQIVKEPYRLWHWLASWSTHVKSWTDKEVNKSTKTSWTIPARTSPKRWSIWGYVGKKTIKRDSSSPWNKPTSKNSRH